MQRISALPGDEEFRVMYLLLLRQYFLNSMPINHSIPLKVPVFASYFAFELTNKGKSSIRIAVWTLRSVLSVDEVAI